MLSILLNLSLLNYQLTENSLILELNEKPTINKNYEMFIDNKFENEIEISSKTTELPLKKKVNRSIIIKNKDNEIYIPTYSLNTCENLIPKGYINEISVDDDFIELFIPSNENLDFFYLEIDKKKIPIEHNGLITINHKLPRTDEQISLKFLNHTVDAFCYQSKNPTESETKDFKEFEKVLGNCYEIRELPKDTSFNRINFNSEISLLNFGINSKQSPNSFLYQEYKEPNSKNETNKNKQNEIKIPIEKSSLNEEAVKDDPEILQTKKEIQETNNDEQENKTITQEKIEVPSLIIDSVMPNPTGTDAENEFINVKNYSNKTIKNITIGIKDKSLNTEEYLIEIIEPQEILSIFPKKVTLNNSNELIQIYHNQSLLDEIAYSNSNENELIYKHTFENLQEPSEKIEKNETNKDLKNKKDVNLIITEIYPNPKDNENEWIEIHNLGEEINTDEITIKVNGKAKKIENHTLKSNQYTSVKISPLSNTAAELEIYYEERLLNKIRYENSIKGYSFSLLEKNYYWIKHNSKNNKNHSFKIESGKVEEISEDNNLYKINNTNYNSEFELNIGDKIDFKYYEHQEKKYIFEIINITENQEDTTKDSNNKIKYVSLGTITLLTLFIKYFNNIT